MNYGITPNILGGINIYESLAATEITSEPVKKHKVTKAQLKHLEKHMFKGITYHDRIQKKWNKRFGFKRKPCIIKTHLGWFIHPSLIQEFRSNMSNVG